MKTYIITLKDIPESYNPAVAAYIKLKQWGHEVHLFDGVNGKTQGIERLKNEKRTKDKDTLRLDQYHISLLDREGVIGCFYSHYDLWKKCYELNEPIIIAEDDLIIYRKYLPVEYEDILLLAVNFDVSRSEEDHLFKEKTFKPLLNKSNRTPTSIPYISDSIPGATAYAINPSGAKKLLDRYNSTYNAADFCINSDVCDIKIHSHLIGRASNSKSLTQNFSYYT